ncbi:hypothetical protein BH23PAT2_BH23PAT2_07700 [soil metagenome]
MDRKAYHAYKNMIYRCTNPKNKYYRIYGGRGIKVCDEWLESFNNFIEDMGQPPSRSHSLDRIDSDGDYEPLNCRWADSYTQATNTSRVYKDRHCSNCNSVCPMKKMAKGLCWKCYTRLWSHGDVIDRRKYRVNSPRPNTSGAMGVIQIGKRFAARYRGNHVGMFDTLKQASEAYQKVREQEGEN